MSTLVSSDELAKDVTGAEALLERHKVCMSVCVFLVVYGCEHRLVIVLFVWKRLGL